MTVRLLDLFCGAGGCSVDYHRAGFTEIVGVDCAPQPNYPFAFVRGDALEYVAFWGAGFDAIHASPPCQVHSAAKRIGNATPGHRDLLPQTRTALESAGRPWVIENVPGAPLVTPIVLCGTAFGLPLRRHRLFESSVFLLAPPNRCRHRAGDLTVFGHAVQVCGSRGTAYLDRQGRTHYRQKRLPLARGQEAMGIDWMTRGELSQAIPPAFTEFIGRQLLAAARGG